MAQPAPIDPKKDPKVDLGVQAASFGKTNQKKAPDPTSSLAILYTTLQQLQDLSQTCKVYSLQPAAQSLQPTPVEKPQVTDPISLLKEALSPIKEQDCSNNPELFYKGLFHAALIAKHSQPQILKNKICQILKDYAQTVTLDFAHQKSFAYSLAGAYRSISHNSPKTELLEEVLNFYIKGNSSTIDTVKQAYLHSIKTDNVIPQLKSHHQKCATAFENSANWQKSCDKLVADLKSGAQDPQIVSKIIQLIGKACSPSQVKPLADILSPLLDQEDTKMALGQYLALHFTDLKDPAASQEQLLQFSDKLKGAIPNQHHQALENCAGVYQSQHVFNQTNPLTQNQLNSETQNVGQSVSNNVNSNGFVHQIVWNTPLLMAMYILLMSGQGAYGYLGDIMGNINDTLSDLQKFTSDVQKIQDDINQLMKNASTSNPSALVQDIAANQSDLQNLLAQYGDKLSPELIQDIKNFSTTSLNDVVSEATSGKVLDWSDLSSNPAAIAQVQAYLTNESGGAAGQAATGVFKNMTDLLGGLNTQNSAQMEELNLITKKVDSLTQLFSSSATTFKTLIQLLTNYDGI